MAEENVVPIIIMCGREIFQELFKKMNPCKQSHTIRDKVQLRAYLQKVKSKNFKH